MDNKDPYADQDSVTVGDCEIVKVDCDSDAEVDVSSCRRSGFFSNDLPMVPRVEEGSNDYESLKRSFVTGLRDFGRNIDVIGIYKKNYDWSVMEVARMEAFRVFATAVANRNGGDPNFKYGWYGGSRAEFHEILRYGFRRFENKSSSYGRGVYLSPASIPMESVKASVVDPDYLRHVILCRVIIGNPEVVSFGSEIEQPSSMVFDSGVDDLSSPTKYVIWEPYMNTHILPLYVISFRVKSSIQWGSLARGNLRSPNMSISGLMRNLTEYVSDSKMAMIKEHQKAYCQNKILRPEFIRHLRVIAGDDILRVVILGLG